MSYPPESSILQHASQPGEDVIAAAGQHLQALLSSATQVAQSVHGRMAEQARQVQAVREAERRQFQQRQDAEYEADRLVWRRVMDDRFWDKATPERIARAWEACVPWALGGFPGARAAAEHLRAEIRTRYRIDVDPVETRTQDLLTLLASGTEAVDRAAAAEPEHLGSATFRIRDRFADDQTIEAAGVVHLAADEGDVVARLLAAQKLLEHQREHGGQAPDRFVIEVFAGADPGEADPPRFTLEAADARAAHQWGSETAAQTRSGDVAAIAAGTPPGAIAEALRWARRQAREELADSDRAEQTEAVRARLGQLALRVQAADADARGEDGQVVFAWAQLRGELQDGWDQTTPAEAAAVWRQVEEWSPGRVRDQAQTYLGNAIQRRFGVRIPEAATADQVREALAAAAPSAPGGPEQRTPEDGQTTDGQTTDARTTRAEADVDQAAEAAEVYQQMAQSGDDLVAEAAEAASTVALAYTDPPSERLAQTRESDDPAGPAGTDRPRERHREADQLER